jgi:hypothetical protein
MNPPLFADAGAEPLEAVDTPDPFDLLYLRRGLWQRHAACAGHTDLFFGPDNESPAERHRRVGVALDVCATCPVQASCRDAARTEREIGVWGGETDEERAEAGFPPRNLSRRSVIRATRAGRLARAADGEPPMRDSA